MPKINKQGKLKLGLQIELLRSAKPAFIAVSASIAAPASIAAVGIAFCLLVFTPRAHAERSMKLTSIFHHPVIIGASVSSGLFTEGPGNRAARQFTSAENITNQARSGAAAREFTSIDRSWAEKYSVIIAVDFLFWDSLLLNPDQSLHALRNLIRSAAQAHVPLVLGDIPNSRPTQVTREILNRAIHSQCRIQNRCYVLPLAALYQRAEGPGVAIDGQQYRLHDLTYPDGLHLRSLGSDYASRLIVALLSRRNP